MAQTKKSRKGIGGRKPLPKGERRETYSIRLPGSLLQHFKRKAKGNAGAIVEELIRDYLKGRK